jgi:hypothetical protein
MWFLFLFLSGCQQVATFSQACDRFSFTTLGMTFFSSPVQVSLKRLHLDFGSLFGRLVVVEGDLLEVGEFSTFAVLHDEDHRLLVVLTGCHQKLSQGPMRLRVMGLLQNGDKGYPYVQARAFYEHQRPQH